MQVDIDEDDAASRSPRRPAAATSAPPTPQSLRDVYAEIDRAEKAPFEAPEFLDYRELYPWLAVAGARPAAARGRRSARPCCGSCHDRVARSAGPRGARSLVGGAGRVPRLGARGGAPAALRRRSSRRRCCRRVAPDVDPRRRTLRAALLVAAAALLVVALAGPMWGFRWEEVQREGIDLVVALDTSRSMLATDVKPNRLARAKLAVRDLVAEAARRSHRRWCRSPARPSSQCPLTLDTARSCRASTRSRSASSRAAARRWPPPSTPASTRSRGARATTRRSC